MRKSLAISGMNLDNPPVRALHDAIALCGGVVSASTLIGVHKMHLYRCLQETASLEPEHARILCKESGNRIKIDEICPGAYGKLHHKELSYTVRK
jgi:hypothetical protein